MRVIIDSNGMATDELRTFLSMSPENRAIITDYTAMEAFKENPLTSIQASWSVLRHFPMQVLVLKGTKVAGTIDPRAPGMGNRLIWKEETQAVRQFVGALDRAAAGEQFIIDQLLQRGEWARDHMNSILNQSGEMNLTIDEFCAFFSENDLSIIRKGSSWSAALMDKFMALVLRLTSISLDKHPDKPIRPTRRHFLNHFLFRHALCYAVYMLQLVKKGTQNRKPETVRNDAVDVILATYATYFNGLMSADSQASVIHHLGRYLLEKQGARIAEDYLEQYAMDIAAIMDAEADSR